jgi:hypothetical protein
MRMTCDNGYVPLQCSEMRPMKRRRMPTLVAAPAMVTAACTGCDGPAPFYPAAPDDGANSECTLTVYSRERFERQTGISVRTRWGDPVDLAEQIIEDDADSPAEVFYAPMSDALGSLSAAGRPATLSDRQPLSGDDLPDSILGFADPAWRGRIAWDPTARSLQDAVTGLRQILGEKPPAGGCKASRPTSPPCSAAPAPVIDAMAAGAIPTSASAAAPTSTTCTPRATRRTSPPGSAPLIPRACSTWPASASSTPPTNRAAASALVDFMLSTTAQ